MLEDKLRRALVPQYQQLFTEISRLETGVKFLLDLRVDILVRKYKQRRYNVLFLRLS